MTRGLSDFRGPFSCGRMLTMTEEQALVVLHHCRGVGYGTLEKIVKRNLSFSTFLSLSPKEWVYQQFIKKENLSKFQEDLQQIDYSNLKRAYERRGIAIIPILDERYPASLKEIDTPPFVLYVKGRMEWLSMDQMLAIVGSRKMSTFAQKNLEKILPPLLQDNWLIVSGLAKGVDTLTHKLTMALGGKTIGVLGAGFGYIYPKENKALMEQMGNQQLLITEYPFHYPPNKWQFPFRNRIISGLTRGTLVLEAKERSGSLITANYALEQGREVFACPGPPSLEAFVGTNELILNGAKLVQNGQDILEELPKFTG